MPLTLRADRRIELRWWWEGPPQGGAMLQRDRLAVRRYLAQIGARPQLLHGLRRFLREGAPGLWTPLSDSEVIDRLAAAVVAGQVHIAESPVERLVARDGEAAEEAPAEPVARRAPEPAPPAEDVCWPCLLRAAASARALRDAAAAGDPFVLEG